MPTYESPVGHTSPFAVGGIPEADLHRQVLPGTSANVVSGHLFDRGGPRGGRQQRDTPDTAEESPRARVRVLCAFAESELNVVDGKYRRVANHNLDERRVCVVGELRFSIVVDLVLRPDADQVRLSTFLIAVSLDVALLLALV